VLESRLAADEDRISELEQNVIESKQAAAASEQLLLEVSQCRRYSLRYGLRFFCVETENFMNFFFAVNFRGQFHCKFFLNGTFLYAKVS